MQQSTRKKSKDHWQRFFSWKAAMLLFLKRKCPFIASIMGLRKIFCKIMGESIGALSATSLIKLQISIINCRGGGVTMPFSILLLTSASSKTHITGASSDRVSMKRNELESDELVLFFDKVDEGPARKALGMDDKKCCDGIIFY